MTTPEIHQDLINGRFLAADLGRIWYVADTHDPSANGTARVKSRKEATKWIESIQSSEVKWDSQYFPAEGVTADGKHTVRKIEPDRWEIDRGPKLDPVVCATRGAAELYLRERALWWADNPANFGCGIEATFCGDDGVVRAETVVRRINWMDNSEEIVGHLGGRRQLTGPHGDACY